MHDEVTRPELGPTTIDDVSVQLGALRLEHGRPSYAEIATRIAERRLAQGASPERARIARSTVYDAFRRGRKRLDVDLVREILLALHLDDASVTAWTDLARRATPGPASSQTAEPHRPREGGTPARGEELPVVVAHSDPLRPTAGPTTGPTSGPTTGPLPAPVGAEVLAPDHAPPPRSLRRTVLLLLACLALNLGGRELVVQLDLPLHLDMTGTAVAAIMAGPWWGALVGVSTNLAGSALSGVSSYPFALVNVAGALVWGYGVHRWGMGRTIPRFFTLNLLAAFVCSAVATPILVYYQGEIIHSSNTVLENVVALFHALLIGTFLGNLLISAFDKTISGVVALIVVETRAPGGTALALTQRPTSARGGPRGASGVVRARRRWLSG